MHNFDSRDGKSFLRYILNSSLTRDLSRECGCSNPCARVECHQDLYQEPLCPVADTRNLPVVKRLRFKEVMMKFAKVRSY